jgi:hypothetical protein
MNATAMTTAPIGTRTLPQFAPSGSEDLPVYVTRATARRSIS